MYSRRYGHAYFQPIIHLMLCFLLNRHKEVKVRTSNRLSITYPRGITQEVSDAYIAHIPLYGSHQNILFHPNSADTTDPARQRVGRAIYVHQVGTPPSIRSQTRTYIYTPTHACIQTSRHTGRLHSKTPPTRTYFGCRHAYNMHICRHTIHTGRD